MTYGKKSFFFSGKILNFSSTFAVAFVYTDILFSEILKKNDKRVFLFLNTVYIISFWLSFCDCIRPTMLLQYAVDAIADHGSMRSRTVDIALPDGDCTVYRFGSTMVRYSRQWHGNPSA